jgi:hypothetical protein
MFVVIQAIQGKETRLFVVADDASWQRFDGLQPRQFATR